MDIRRTPMSHSNFPHILKPSTANAETSHFTAIFIFLKHVIDQHSCWCYVSTILNYSYAISLIILPPHFPHFCLFIVFCDFSHTLVNFTIIIRTNHRPPAPSSMSYHTIPSNLASLRVLSSLHFSYSPVYVPFRQKLPCPITSAHLYISATVFLAAFLLLISRTPMLIIELCWCT